MAEGVIPAKQGARKWTDYVTKKRVIGGIVAIAALLFIFQNTGTGHFHFLWFDFSAPRWIWLLAVLAGGFATCWLWLRHRAATGAKA